MRVLVAERKGASQVRRGRVSFQDALSEGTFFIIVAPSDASTRNMFANPEFEAMNSSAVIINVGSGSMWEFEAPVIGTNSCRRHQRTRPRQRSARRTNRRCCNRCLRARARYPGEQSSDRPLDTKSRSKPSSCLVRLKDNQEHHCHGEDESRSLRRGQPTECCCCIAISMTEILFDIFQGDELICLNQARTLHIYRSVALASTVERCVSIILRQ